METFQNSENLLRILQNSDKTQLFLCLQNSYKIMIDNKTKQPQAINVSSKDVSLLVKLIQENDYNSDSKILKEAIRCLRNCAIKNPEIQKEIISNQTLICQFMDLLLNCKVAKDLKLTIITLFLNVCINNGPCGANLWKHLNFIELLKNDDLKGKLFALLYNILLFNESTTIVEPSVELVKEIIHSLGKNYESFEFAHFNLDLLIKTDKIINFYANMQTADRVIILQHLKSLQLANEAISWSKMFVEMITNDFKRKSDCILKTVTVYLNEIEPHEVALLADIIATFSSNEQSLKFIQHDRNLLINCVFLLRAMHEAGKNNKNHFTTLNKLVEIEQIGNEIETHPAFGFQVHMIRILGNFAWNSKSNQDEMRELDAIPLLLDCCNIDGRNPLIMQWAIFAIRNLCHKNIENQRILASIDRKSFVDSKTISELGLTLNDDGNNPLNIVPINK